MSARFPDKLAFLGAAALDEVPHKLTRERVAAKAVPVAGTISIDEEIEAGLGIEWLVRGGDEEDGYTKNAFPAGKIAPGRFTMRNGDGSWDWTSLQDPSYSNLEYLGRTPGLHKIALNYTDAFGVYRRVAMDEDLAPNNTIIIRFNSSPNESRYRVSARIVSVRRSLKGSNVSLHFIELTLSGHLTFRDGTKIPLTHLPNELGANVTVHPNSIIVSVAGKALGRGTTKKKVVDNVAASTSDWVVGAPSSILAPRIELRAASGLTAPEEYDQMDRVGGIRFWGRTDLDGINLTDAFKMAWPAGATFKFHPGNKVQEYLNLDVESVLIGDDNVELTVDSTRWDGGPTGGTILGNRDLVTTHRNTVAALPVAVGTTFRIRNIDAPSIRSLNRSLYIIANAASTRVGVELTQAWRAHLLGTIDTTDDSRQQIKVTITRIYSSTQPAHMRRPELVAYLQNDITYTIYPVFTVTVPAYQVTEDVIETAPTPKFTAGEQVVTSAVPALYSGGKYGRPAIPAFSLWARRMTRGVTPVTQSDQELYDWVASSGDWTVRETYWCPCDSRLQPRTWLTDSDGLNKIIVDVRPQPNRLYIEFDTLAIVIAPDNFTTPPIPAGAEPGDEVGEYEFRVQPEVLNRAERVDTDRLELALVYDRGAPLGQLRKLTWYPRLHDQIPEWTDRAYSIGVRVPRGQNRRHWRAVYTASEDYEFDTIFYGRDWYPLARDLTYTYWATDAQSGALHDVIDIRLERI